eukprot:CAMPEP_0194165840 /NCGR_PEP_ID=MMETSP0154-20130528/1645_1 /TAXON_ID=1049557 /ORGANISM="Thalassiothrix antarctica, Strain L6-D1" /LENGTH=75 /DNA_ID=CAMNT_0038876381 /DNA_START=138 /DNA_END=365 /DNA_ORIENTATION=-
MAKTKTDTTKATKKKVSAAPGRKKKPLSGYMKFAKEHRQQVKDENADITFGQIGKKLGEMWRALDDKEKEEYKNK